MAYDPQKTRNRPAPAADQPAPVDAFLDAMSEVTVLPEGIDIEVTPAGDTIVHTADAAIAITPAGDDTYETTLSLDKAVVQDLRALYLGQVQARAR